MDPTGYYCILRLRNRSRGEKLNIGIIAFWRWGWAVHTENGAIDRALSAFPEVDEIDLRDWLGDLAKHLGFRAPGEFDPNYAYVAIHQFRQQHWQHEHVEISTLRPVRVGYDGVYGYEGGVDEAAEDLYARMVAPVDVDVFAAA